jgi:hypothetical protein
MEAQIIKNYEKAFKNLIAENLNSDKPDYNWITELYSEIKTRLQKLVQPTNKLYREMEENLDPVLFRQMLEYKVFSSQDFEKLLNFVFKMCLQLGSPGRDADVLEIKKSINDMYQNGSTFHQIVGEFIFEINKIIDWIYQDIQNLVVSI